MPQPTRPQFSLADDERDGRLNHAMDLLASGGARRNGALPLIAMAGLVLSGALLATIAGSEPQKTVKPTESAIATNDAPKADFELSGSSVAAPATTTVLAGTEKDR